jgi:hypothetical protein
VGVTQVTGQTMTQLSNALQVQIKDPHGNPVSGTNVTYTIAQQPAGSTGAELTAASVASDTSGIASNWFKPGSKIGTSYITASVSGLVGSPITFQCTITPSALDRFVLHLAQTTTDTGNSWGGVTLMAYDAYNNLKTDYRGSVWFTATDPLAIMPWTQESRYGFVTADNGSHVFENFVFLTAGSGTITVTDGTISATSVQITVTDNIASDGTIQVVSFTMPGDAYSIFALARPSVGLERPPQMIYQSSSGIQLDLQTSSMANNTYLGIGRLSGASPVGGKVHVIGVKAGTLNYITGEDVVAK